MMDTDTNGRWIISLRNNKGDWHRYTGPGGKAPAYDTLEEANAELDRLFLNRHHNGTAMVSLLPCTPFDIEFEDAPPVAVTEYREGWPEQCVHARFDTLAEAEAWIARRTEIDPEGVYAGVYGIEAPEEMVNP